MTDILETVLTLSDQGEPVEQIAAAVELSPGHVYAILREYRPDRPRKQHPRTSKHWQKLLELYAQEYEPTEIAAELGISRQRVHKMLLLAFPPCPIPLPR